MYSLAVPSVFRQWHFTKALPLLTDSPTSANDYDAADQETEGSHFKQE